MEIRNVTVNYPTDETILEELENRAAKAYARALISEFSPAEIDRIIRGLETMDL